MNIKGKFKIIDYYSLLLLKINLKTTLKLKISKI